jgi:hypothetical protein
MLSEARSVPLQPRRGGDRQQLHRDWGPKPTTFDEGRDVEEDGDQDGPDDDEGPDDD